MTEFNGKLTEDIAKSYETYRLTYINTCCALVRSNSECLLLVTLIVIDRYDIIDYN